VPVQRLPFSSSWGLTQPPRLTAPPGSHDNVLEIDCRSAPAELCGACARAVCVCVHARVARAHLSVCV
jgi:hypothetical protein